MAYVIKAQLVPSERRFTGNGAWRNEPEEVDMASNRNDAEHLVSEYSMAYGTKFTVWAEPMEDSP